MCHIDRSTRKNILGYKSSRGGKKAIRGKGAPKNSVDFFLFSIFLDNKVFVGRQKIQQGDVNW